jgi:hypothetical protein
VTLLEGDSNIFSARKREDKNPNMKRLKILFNTRRVRNTK